MGLTLREQETTITFYRDSDICKVYTSDSTVMTKLDKLVKSPKTPYWKLEEEHRLQNGDLAGKTYKTHKDLITFRSNFKKVSDEQREILSGRAKQNFGDWWGR